MSCLMDCNFVGSCIATVGFCQCPAGWKGEGCLTRHRRPCTHEIRSWGFEAMNPTVNLSDFATNGMPMSALAHRISSLCAGTCDDDIAVCMCPSHTRQGRKPAGPMSLPNDPPITRGRPMGQWCQPNKDEHGVPVAWGTIDPTELYDEATGWCSADVPSKKCDCYLDGLGGYGCDEPYEQTCPNQCGGHGECYLGFCKCHDGWFGHDCAYRMQGIPDSPGLEVERPWIAPMVDTPAAREPAQNATRLRPLIWVYEMPTEFNSLLLQYRVDRNFCTHRLFHEQNVSHPMNNYVYQLEMALHEMMLQSPHRTLDPEEADFFYIPIYSACLIMPINYWADEPWYHGPGMGRTHSATELFQDAFHWIRSRYPYWNRKGGRDHIWTVTHDEGSCWIPDDIRSSIILSHWGRTDANHTSWTGYRPDNYSVEHHHPLYMPKGHLRRISTSPCYDPHKDLIVPSAHTTAFYDRSPMVGAPGNPRTRLGLFKGRMQLDNPPYSRGTRQRMARAAWAGDWAGKHNIFVGDHLNFTGMASYSELMTQTIFCLAVIGDGWTTRYEDAIVHGCIPVIVMDNVEPVFSSIVDPTTISVRVAFADVERIPEILRAIPAEEIRRLQTNIGRVWTRFAWSSQKAFLKDSQNLLESNLKLQAANTSEVIPARLGMRDLTKNDAFQTLMEWLYERMDR